MNVSIVGVTVITHLLKNQIYLRVKKVLIGSGLKKKEGGIKRTKTK
jgi:hypothetical protein